MKRKEIIQALIANKQSEIPFSVNARELKLPLQVKKIITIPGVRRCGKSSLMMLAINDLIAKGIDKKKILWLGFDDERLYDMTTSELDEVITAYSEMFPDISIREVYMFFDEIQIIEKWELFVLRLYKSYCKNIYISGSNAFLLSGELSSALRGWPIEYNAYPLSFKEFCNFKQVDYTSYTENGKAKIKKAFIEFNNRGGFPEIALTKENSLKDNKLQGYFNTMLFRDLVEHYKISNPEIARYFIKRIMANIGCPTSILKIYKDIKSQGYAVGKEMLYELSEHICSIFMFFKIPKYVKSIIKEENSLHKYYCIDNGLKNSVLIPQNEDNGKSLENSVFLHLKRNCLPTDKIYYYSGKNECDFVKQNGDKISNLIQVTWDMHAESTRNRELNGILEASKATGCKNLTIVTNDDEEIIKINNLDINVVPAWKWLLKK
ncbi:MAG: ATP-binding protein [Bacteroidales bacterium]|jgi:predicted AAA+ superfamily ATPase|nr:ATP-binding protein [Bacteroidales bacterium]